MIMRSVRILAVVLAVAVSGTAFAYSTVWDSSPTLTDRLVIVKNKQTVTHACTGKSVVVVSGNKNIVTLTGDCARVEVDGNKNIVTIDGVGKLSVRGNNNTRSWKQGVGGKRAKVSNTGNGNKVHRASAKKGTDCARHFRKCGPSCD